MAYLDGGYAMSPNSRTPLRDVAGSYDRAAEAPTPPCIWEEDELEGSEDEEAEHDIDTPEEPVAGTAADSKPQTVGTPLRDATNGMNGSRGTLKAKTPLSKNANHTMALDEVSWIPVARHLCSAALVALLTCPACHPNPFQYLKAEKTFTHTTATPVKKGLSQQPAGLATKALQGRQDHCRVFADSSDHTSADVQSRPTTHLSSTAPPMDRWW